MILLLTNSRDVTTDALMPHLSARAEVFRFNVDLWRNYSWNIHPGGFELQDPTGRICTESCTGAVYERKVMFDPPFVDIPAEGSPESWLREEVRLIWSGLKDLAFHEGKLALIHPSPYGTWYKMRQMRLASAYFPVPDWQMLHRSPVQLASPIVCKTNGAQPLGQGRHLTVSKVDSARLDTQYPWFLQQMVSNAVADVTVAYVAGKLFAGELPCQSGAVDSRVRTFNGADAWQPCELSRDEQQRIIAMMQETGLSFARLDFMRTTQGLQFLEFNPNGQFAWIDYHNERGLYTAIVDEIMRIHRKHLPA